MHIPTHMIQGNAVTGGAAIGAASCIAAAALMAARASRKEAATPSAAVFASVTAFIFAAQMMNFPVQSGTSGHLIGASLAVMLLGMPHAVLSMSVVLAVQCLVFADGGLDTLGANILNMAVIAAIPAAFVKTIIQGSSRYSGAARNILIASASWFSVVIASVACSAELALSGTIAAAAVFPSMTGVHSLIGIGEALITVSAVLAFEKAVSLKREDQLLKKSFKLPLVSAAVIAMLLSPFASSYPDGLEWVAEKYSFLHDAMPLFASPMSDYAVPFINNEAFSTSAAGTAGIAIVFLLSYLAGSAIERGRLHGNA